MPLSGVAAFIIYFDYIYIIIETLYITFITSEYSIYMMIIMIQCVLRTKTGQ